jgi:glycosyltransferase involved in cell wall biosynthesis
MKISILTASHNDERFIKDCAQSVLGQAYPDFEWVVVDDCSSDKTFEILSDFKDPRLRLFRNDDQLFCSSTYARALKEARGDICAIVDGDDALVAKAIKTLAKLYQKNRELGYIYTQHWWCDNKLNRKRKGLSAQPPMGMSMSRLSLKKNAHSFSHWRTFRRYLAKGNEIFPKGLKYSVDKHMGFVLERIAYGGFYPEPLYLYRYYKGNMSLTHAKDQKEIWKTMAKKFEKSGKKALPIRRLR